MRGGKVASVALCVVVTLAACGGGGSVLVSDPWTRPIPDASPNTAFYLTIRNPTDTGDRLVAAASPACSTIEFHESTMSDGVMSMREVPGGELRIPAGEDVVLAPGGLHLMCVGTQVSMTAGATLSLTLEFADAGTYEVEVAVDER